MQLYAGLVKYSCDMCGELGERATHRVIHKSGTKADICKGCHRKCLAHPKFNEGVKNGEIKVIEI